MYIDSAANQITVEDTNRTSDGQSVVIARLVDDPATGYVAAITGDGGFGSKECPSSYNRPVLAWFGPGERFADAESLLAAICDN